MNTRKSDYRSLAVLAVALALAGTTTACKKADENATDKAKTRSKAPAVQAKTSAGTASNEAPAVTAGDSNLQGAAGNYEFDPSHTHTVFWIEHFGVSHQHGRFNKTTGTISLDAKAPTKSTVALEIATGSIFTADKKRDKHLRSPDLFDAKQFPTITFKSSNVVATGADTYDVTGKLSLHGVDKSITIPVSHLGSGKDPFGGFRSGFETKFTVRRSDYGMNFMNGPIGDEVHITVAIEAIRK